MSTGTETDTDPTIAEARAYARAVLEGLAAEVAAARAELAARLERIANRPEALLLEHPGHPGDWTVWVAALPQRTFGRHATREDARRAAERMGFRVGEIIESETV